MTGREMGLGVDVDVPATTGLTQTYEFVKARGIFHSSCMIFLI